MLCAWRAPMRGCQGWPAHSCLVFVGAHRIEERTLGDGHSVGPANVFEYLSTVMYNRRNKFDPLWNSVVVAGVANGARCVKRAHMCLCLCLCVCVCLRVCAMPL
jgi:hypothetical protein